MIRSTIRARTLLTLGASLAALAAMPALAQDTSSSSEPQAEEAIPDGDIIVSARRRDESLLDVPIAVSAFSGAQLDQSGAIDLTDIGQVTPNVTLEVSRGTNSTLTAFIRGVGQQDPVAGYEAGVGIYLDDVYLNRPQAAVLDIYDVERIEVLRGPQGTLYGRNTIGGAVKYVTRRLGDDPTVSARATYGSYNQIDGVLSGSVPIADGTVKIGGAVARLTRDGFGTNLFTGDENYNKDVFGARGTIQIEPASSLFIRLSGDYTLDKSNPRGGYRLITSLATGQPVRSGRYDSLGGLVSPAQRIEAYGGSLFVEAKPSDWLTFRSITGYRKDDSSTPIDFDALPAVDVDVPAFYNNKQFSQEAQLLINSGGFNGLVGVYYLDAKARTVFDVRTPNRITALTFGDVKTDTVAVFGDFTYDFADIFSVSVGGRYTWDNRTAIVLRNAYLGDSPFFGGTTAPILPQTNFRGQASFKKFTPRASVSVKPGGEHLIYASYSQGFKGGGFDPRGVGISAPDFNGNGINGLGGDRQDIYDFLSFDPESVDSYEIGWKGSLFDRRLTFSFAGFHMDYTDVQIPGSVGVTIGGIQTFAGLITNAGRAQVRGLEGEVNWTVARGLFADLDRLTLSGTAGYLDAKYKTYISQVNGQAVDVAANRKFQNTPDLTASGTIAYSGPLAGGRLNLSSTVSYRSDSQQFELRTPGLDQPGFALWDANLVYDVDDHFSVGIHGRNLTDKRYIVSGYNFLSQNPLTGDFVRNAQGRLMSTLGAEGVLTAYYGNPRQLFVTLTAKY